MNKFTFSLGLLFGSLTFPLYAQDAVAPTEDVLSPAVHDSQVLDNNEPEAISAPEARLILTPPPEPTGQAATR